MEQLCTFLFRLYLVYFSLVFIFESVQIAQLEPVVFKEPVRQKWLLALLPLRDAAGYP